MGPVSGDGDVQEGEFSGVAEGGGGEAAERNNENDRSLGDYLMGLMVMNGCIEPDRLNYHYK